MRLADLARQKVAILGFGREGRNTLAVLRREFPELVITVIEEGELADDPLLQDASVRVENRKLCGEELTAFDVLIKAPGISRYRPDILQAEELGLKVTSLTSLWLAASRNAMVVGVTGTKGKSTTATLLRDMLQAGGKNVALRGNIGRPLFDQDEPEDDCDVVVLELSSYQLADLEGELDIAVLTNLSPEHLSWHGDEERYFNDKLRIAGLARSVIANAGCPRLRRKLEDNEKVIWFGESQALHASATGIFRDGERLIRAEELQLLGRHNLENVCAALSAAEAAGVPMEKGAESARECRPLPHRLEGIGVPAGRLFVNDSLASTPVATMAAIESFPDARLHVIVGGADRGLELTEFVAFLRAHSSRVSLSLIGPFGARLHQALEEQGASFADLLPDLNSAVTACWENSGRADVILLSPGAPSFDAFRDYAERGEAFRAAVERLA